MKYNSIMFKAYTNFINECIGINNVKNINVSIKILGNDELVFDVFININLSQLVNIDINRTNEGI